MGYDTIMAKEILQTMGKRIRALRESDEIRLNQIELAAAVRARGVECTNSMISSIETGRANPSLEVFVAIADVLDVTLDYLATRTDVIDSPAAMPAPPPDVGAGITEEAEIAADLIDGIRDVRRRLEIVEVVELLTRQASATASQPETESLEDYQRRFVELARRMRNAPQVGERGRGR